jgi:hypothetical protein
MSVPLFPDPSKRPVQSLLRRGAHAPPQTSCTNANWPRAELWQRAARLSPAFRAGAMSGLGDPFVGREAILGARL